MIIEIKGVQFVNKGAELMLHAVLEKIYQNWPDAEIVLEPNRFSPYMKRAQLDAFQKLSIRKNRLDLNWIAYRLPAKLRRALKHRWGLVTEADVDLVLDASGFAYGDQWGSLKIKHLAAELRRYHRAGKKYIFLPQAMGPFSRNNDKRRLNKTLKLATLVCPRESDSLAFVLRVMGEISAPDNVVKYPDFTNLVTGQVPEYFANGQNKVLIIPNSNMVGSKNTHKPAWKTNYVTMLTNAVAAIREQGLEPVLLNHEGDGDGELCREVQKLAGGKQIEYIEESHPVKVKGIIGASKAIICSRFHGCVSALSQGTPCLGTSWSHKYERLFDEYSRGDFLLTPDVTKSRLSELLALSISTSTNSDYQAAISLNKEQAQEMWARVVERVGR